MDKMMIKEELAMSRTVGARVTDELNALLEQQAEASKMSVGEMIRELLEQKVNGKSAITPGKTAMGTRDCPHCGQVTNWETVKTENKDFGSWEFGLVKRCPGCKKIVYRQSKTVFDLVTVDCEGE
jgi:endogenous inhibitor of DNA gyrase (YacG/DUF329 family)